MKLTPDFWLEGVLRDPIAGGSPMNVRRALVIHYTEGATAESSVDAMKERGVSAHVVIDRDGSIRQCRPFNIECAHAGKSRWQDPKTGTRYGSANDYAIGIEIANAGAGEGALSWARKQPGFKSIKARHRNGGPEKEWEQFYEPQLSAVFELSKLLVARFNLDDVTGHDCIAPDRKEDPGPAFPMLQLRLACGFEGLPVVFNS